jgi:hypothetical protein
MNYSYAQFSHASSQLDWSGPSPGNRRASDRFNRQFKFLELDDDGCLASIAKEKFGFAVGPSGSDPASVAELKCFPHIMPRQIGDHPSAAFDRGQRVFRQANLASAPHPMGSLYRIWPRAPR